MKLSEALGDKDKLYTYMYDEIKNGAESGSFLMAFHWHGKASALALLIEQYEKQVKTLTKESLFYDGARSEAALVLEDLKRMNSYYLQKTTEVLTARIESKR